MRVARGSATQEKTKGAQGSLFYSTVCGFFSDRYCSSVFRLYSSVINISGTFGNSGIIGMVWTHPARMIADKISEMRSIFSPVRSPIS